MKGWLGGAFALFGGIVSGLVVADLGGPKWLTYVAAIVVGLVAGLYVRRGK